MDQKCIRMLFKIQLWFLVESYAVGDLREALPTLLPAPKLNKAGSLHSGCGPHLALVLEGTCPGKSHIPKKISIFLPLKPNFKSYFTSVPVIGL